MARRALLQARDAVVRSEGRLARLKTVTGEMVERVVQTAEVQAASFGMGLVNGRYTEQTPQGPKAPEVLGIPAELLAGIGLHVAAYAKVAGGASKHLHNLGDGSLAFYFGQLGRGIGIDMAREAALVPGASPVLPAARAATAGGYTDAEIAEMAARGLK
jgi:hypothetical protein